MKTTLYYFEYQEKENKITSQQFAVREIGNYYKIFSVQHKHQYVYKDQLNKLFDGYMYCMESNINIFLNSLKTYHLDRLAALHNQIRKSEMVLNCIDNIIIQGG